MLSLVFFAASAHSGFQLPLYSAFDLSAQHLDLSLAKSHVPHQRACLASERVPQWSPRASPFLSSLGCLITMWLFVSENLSSLITIDCFRVLGHGCASIFHFLFAQSLFF